MRLNMVGSLAVAQKSVKDFHERFAFEIGRAPEVPPAHVLDIGLKLIREEAGEVHRACGFNELGVDLRNNPLRTCEADVVKIAHELSDLVFVALGLATRCGIDLSPVFDAVARANLEKSGPDGPVYRDDGKLLKPPGWKPADVASIIREQIALAPKGDA